MYNLNKKFTKEYDDVKEFSYQRIESSSIFPIKDQSPIHFEVSGVPNIYIDPQEIYLYLQINLLKVKEDGSLGNIEDADPVALEQLPLYTIFKDINVSFNHIEKESTYGYYAYKAYMNIMLSTNATDRKHMLSSALYIEDQYGAMDYVNPGLKDVNPGTYGRNRAAKESKSIHLNGKLLVDTLQVDKPILDKVSLSFTLFPAAPEECLISMAPNSKFIVQIQNCYMLAGRIIPKSLRMPSRSYNFLRHTIKKIPHSKGQPTIGPLIISRGERPKYVTIGLIDEGRLGSYSKARFSFGTFKLQNITLAMDGKELPYTNGYNMDYTKNYYTQPYAGLFHELKDHSINNNIMLPQFPYSWFDSGFTLYVFNCQPDHGNTNVIDNNNVGGSLELTGNFAVPPPENLFLIVMLAYEHSYEIDIHRNVTFNEKFVNDTKSKGIKRSKK